MRIKPHEGEGVRLDLFNSLRRKIEEKMEFHTQYDVADIMGTTQPMVSKILSGDMRNLSSDRLAAFLERLGWKVILRYEEV